MNWLKHKMTDFISSDYSKKFAEYKIYMELLLQAMADYLVKKTAKRKLDKIYETIFQNWTTAVKTYDLREKNKVSPTIARAYCLEEISKLQCRERKLK